MTKQGMPKSLDSIVSEFGRQAKAKLSNPAVTGEPEDQLRAPLELLIADVADLIGFAEGQVAIVGETSLSDLKTRPDFAVTQRNALVGFIEAKAPGKGADPRKFKGHDREQWDKLKSLPNLLYTDGNAFSLWRDGEIVGAVVRLDGDVETSGDELAAPPSLLRLLDDFLRWQPIAPRTAKQLAKQSAHLCRLLRDEVTEQLALGSEALTGLAHDWRKLLFPEANDAEFANGYAQAVTFGLLMARARGIRLADGIDRVAKELGKSNSLIGAALRLLTDDAENQRTLKTSLDTLTRVLDVVDWQTISKGDAGAWLYFYEDFLEIYDNKLRKLTGSYYTPPEVVESMVRLVDDAIRDRFKQPAGLASPAVTVADPAVGTGTFVLGLLRRIAEYFAADEGEGAIAGQLDAAVDRIVGFEMQLGPFAVAQLRILAELVALTGETPHHSVRMFVTDTLADPEVEQIYYPQAVKTIGDSRLEAARVKREERITVVIGNPPYKEKAKDRGGWIEKGRQGGEVPLDAWQPPKEWGVGAHAKHLRNLYVYFWRWATWKVFDHRTAGPEGIVCFITVAGFLNGPGFQRMRDYLRRTCSDVWVIDCSPEGHQPDVPTRIFQGVQQPVCIVLAAKSAKASPDKPATVRFQALPKGKREAKFAALKKLRLTGKGWENCPSEWRAPFLPKATGEWASFPALDNLFIYNGAGSMPGRTWPIAPDPESLRQRWDRLQKAPRPEQESLFHPHEGGDRTAVRVVANGLAGFPDNPIPVADDKVPCLEPVSYGFRSFDRQWIIPDNRLLNRPNPELWRVRSDRQVYLTAPSDRSPTAGPGLTFSGAIPDLHHYNGRGGRTFPLYSDDAKSPNVSPALLAELRAVVGQIGTAEALTAYVAAVAAHPAYTKRFADDLSQPGLRIPLTKDAKLFAEAAELGSEVIWLQTFGERFVDPKAGRPAKPPRLESPPRIPKDGAIPQTPEEFPNAIEYDATQRRLIVGAGYVENVPPEVWSYEVSGKQVLRQWFSYRKKDRTRPIMGDRRPPSPLGDIQPDHWLPEYTTELLNVINVLGQLVELEPRQADLLDRICAGPLLTDDELRSAGAYEKPKKPTKKRADKRQPSLGFGDESE